MEAADSPRRLVEVDTRDLSGLGFRTSDGPAVLIEGDLLMVGWNLWFRDEAVALPMLPDEHDLDGDTSPAGIAKGLALSDDDHLLVNTSFGAYLYQMNFTEL